MGKKTIDSFLILSFVLILGAPFVLFLIGKDEYNSYFPGAEKMVRPVLDLDWTQNFSPSPSWARDVYVSFIDYKYEIDRYFTNTFGYSQKYLIQNLCPIRLLKEKMRCCFAVVGTMITSNHQ